MRRWRDVRVAGVLVSERSDGAGRVWRMTPVYGGVPGRPPVCWRLARRDDLDGCSVIEHRGGFREFDVADALITAAASA